MDSKYTIKFADIDDVPAWMEMITLMRYDFPCLENDNELEKHKPVVIKNINRQSAICVKDNERVIGALLFSFNQNRLGFMAVHPDYRRKGIGAAMIEKMLSALPDDKDVWVRTFRGNDTKGVAARPLYRKMGFEEDALVMEHDYPHQEFVLRRK